jgi:uncharacterized SAM-binding protein YcdF (DUF218 family)
MLPLFRHRSLPVPTVTGWGILALLMFGLLLWLRTGLFPFLAVNEPVVNATEARDPAQVLVLEGWLEADELDHALALYARGGYGRLVTTGGPLLSWREGRPGQSYADRAVDYLREHGPADLAPIAVSATHTHADRTFVSALALRHWWQTQGGRITRIDVVTSGVHARRTRQMFRLALPELAVGVHAADPSSYDGARWWTYSDGVKKLWVESLSVAWSTCCFWPAAPP